MSEVLIRIVADASKYNSTMKGVENTARTTANNIGKTADKATQSVKRNVVSTNTQYGHLINWQKSEQNQLASLGTEIRVNQGTAWDTMKSKAINAMQPMNQKLYETGNRVKQTGYTIKQKLGTEAGLAFGMAGAAALSFAKDCISASIQAESAWTRFGALVNSSGGNWEQNSKEIREWAVDFSNSFGYTTADTREAASALMQYGLTFNEVKEGMKGVAGLAARTGLSEVEASNVIITALNGRGKALKKYTGLNIEDYKINKKQVDTTKLLSDLYMQNAEALSKHANTTEAQVNRLTNLWNSFKMDIGNALMPVIKVIGDLTTIILKGFKLLPDPIKTVIATLVLLGGIIGVVIGALALLAPGIMAIGELMATFGAEGGLIAVLTGLLNPATAVVIAIGAVVAVLWYLYSTNEDVRNSLNDLGNSIRSDLGTAWENFVKWCQKAYQVLEKVGQRIYNMLVPALNQIIPTLYPLGKALMDLVGSFGDLGNALMGSDSFSIVGIIIEDIMLKIQAAIIIVQTVLAIVIPAITFIINYARILITTVAQVIEVINGVCNGSLSLGDAWNKLGSIFSNAGESLRKAAMQLVVSIVDNLKGVFSSLPGVVQEELGNIANAILSVDIVAAIVELASNIIQGFRDELGIHSPGIMARLIQEEMQHIADFISGAVGLVVNAVITLATNIINAFLSIPQGILNALGMIGTVITTQFIQISMIVGNAVNMIKQAITTRFNLLVANVHMIFANIYLAIISKLLLVRTVAGTLVSLIRTAIVTRFNTLNAKVRSIFQGIVNTIRSRLSNAVSNARAKALEIYNGIKNKVSTIPDMVKQEFDKIKDKIKTALDNAKNTAVSCINDLVSAVKSALGIASPGYIQRMFTYEFTSVPGIIVDSTVLAVDKSISMAKAVVGAFEDNLPDALSLPDVVEGVNNLTDGLKVPVSLLGSNLSIGSFDALSSKKLLDDGLKHSIDLNIVSNRVNDGMTGKTGNSILNNIINNNKSSDKTIIIQEMNNTMEMGNLTTAQCRKVLYNALDGLENGGV